MISKAKEIFLSDNSRGERGLNKQGEGTTLTDSSRRQPFQRTKVANTCGRQWPPLPPSGSRGRGVGADAVVLDGPGCMGVNPRCPVQADGDTDGHWDRPRSSLLSRPGGRQVRTQEEARTERMWWNANVCERGWKARGESLCCSPSSPVSHNKKWKENGKNV